MILLMDKHSQTGEAFERALRTEGLDHTNPPLRVNWTGGRQNYGFPVPVLNALSRTNKLSQLIRLEMQGVPVPEWRVFPPATGEARSWFARSANHQQGSDFRRTVRAPDFWTKYLDISEEWRLHFFRSPRGGLRLLRSAQKVPKSNAHPFIRSHKLGWKLSYTGGAPAELRAAARRAVEALALDFGAVDCGLTNGQPVVLEVNTCPGLEGGTLQLYVEQVMRRVEAL